MTHAVCGAHLLRELEGIIENAPSHTWAQEFQSLLLRMKAQKERDIDYGKYAASTYQLHKFNKEYERVIKLAQEQCPPPTAPTEKKRGRQKKGKERSLIERLIDHKESVMRFFTNYLVPFDNNLAERDLRNCKTKIKVSGCFRTLEGARDYLNILSFLSTARKLGVKATDALTDGFTGLVDTIKASTSGLVDTIKASTSGVADTIKASANDVADTIKTSASGVADLAKAGVTCVADALKACTTGVTNAITAGVASLSDFFLDKILH